MRMATPFAIALLTLAGAQTARAQTTVIERDDPDTVVVERPSEERTTIERRESSDGCFSKTVTRENEDGDRKTVTRESCD